jgi:hypothetical protein
MRIVKPNTKELQAVLNFLIASEMALESAKFSFNSPYENYRELDDEDEDAVLIKKLRKQIAAQEGKDEEEVDDRILMYEFLQRKFAYCRTWRSVYWAADVLTETVCDPFDDCLAFHPMYESFHVAPEQ